MKKIISTLAFALLMAATAWAQTSVGVGYLNSIDIVKSGNNTSSNPLNGVYAGVSFTVPVYGGINFTPGIYYGFATQSDAMDLIITTLSGRRTDHFINIPMFLSFGLDLNPGLRFFAYAGPSVSFGLASMVTNKLGTTSSSYDRYKEDSNLNRFDVMLGGGVGVQVRDMFRINVGYDFGMLNRYHNSSSIAYRRNQLTAGIAFLF